ncbi:MAG: peptidoglycan DD-metalloendopeptidase family protein [Clostridiales Family XIII bacterium]|nr:peptidoglycan DD-metalloendopeptidase family protein [Clostridiales Family XIII bacterium]
MNNKLLKISARIVAIVLAVIMVVSCFVYIMPAFAETSDEKLENVKNEINNKKNELAEGQKKEQELAAQVSSLETSIAETEGEIKEIQAQIDAINAKVEELQGQIQIAQREVDDQDSDLNSRLKVMYMSGDQSMLEVLLGSESLSDLMSNLEMVKAIHKADVQLLDELQAKLDEIEAKKQEQEILKARVESSKASLEEKKDKLAADKASLAEAKEKQHAANEIIMEDVEALEAESNRIQAEIQAALAAAKAEAERAAAAAAAAAAANGTPVAAPAGNLSYGGGQLGRPANGPVTSEFGPRQSPGGIGSRNHKGMDFGVPSGSPIVAAADGTVLIAGWSTGGYGNYVIINHGSGLTTLYAHNSSIAVSVGQQVSRGQVIAYSGSTGNSTGPHCHFEVAVNGIQQNPRNYL